MVILPYLAATILSLVSFHTTYYGMRSFYGLGGTGNHARNRISDQVANSVSRYLTIDVLNLFAISFAAVVQGGILLASAYLFRLLLINPIPASSVGTEHTVALVAALRLRYPSAVVTDIDRLLVRRPSGMADRCRAEKTIQASVHIATRQA